MINSIKCFREINHETSNIIVMFKHLCHLMGEYTKAALVLAVGLKAYWSTKLSAVMAG